MAKDNDAQVMVDHFNKMGEVPGGPRQAKPEDLGYVGVQKKGMARQAADAISKRKEEMQNIMKDL